MSCHRASGHQAFGSRAISTSFDAVSFNGLVSGRFADVANAHIQRIQLATVWHFAGVGLDIHNLARHGVWLCVDAGWANFFAVSFHAEFSHD
jgi:hypothetical protein